MKILSTFTILALSLVCFEITLSQQTQIATSTDEDWVVYPSSKIDSLVLECANYSRREWKVERRENSVDILLDKLPNHQAPLPDKIRSKNLEVGTKGHRSVLQVEDGWLVGLDIGEFGGGLWWFSSDGQTNKKLSAENVVGLVKNSNGVLVLTGLAHLSENTGKVLRIVGINEADHKIEKFSDLDSSPQTFVSESADSLLVLTTKSLVRLKADGTVKKLFSIRYAHLYPNSITFLPSGVIYVGMRHFVTRLTPNTDGYKEEWLVPRNCTSFQKSDFDCVCKSKYRQ